MHAVPRLPEQESVPPGDDSNDDPTPPLPAEPDRNIPGRNPAGSSGSTRQPLKNHDKAEPDIHHERDLPSDGRDREGEGMIRELDKPVEPSPEKKPEGTTTRSKHGH
ncbi:hypothetical protein [Polaromonas sp.]|uniref:hypothetical protein n=1 Tax=Polaromonas sp. TaxID=1869339 RepID=UPI0035624F83